MATERELQDRAGIKINLRYSVESPQYYLAVLPVDDGSCVNLKITDSRGNIWAMSKLPIAIAHQLSIMLTEISYAYPEHFQGES